MHVPRRNINMEWTNLNEKPGNGIIKSYLGIQSDNLQWLDF